MNASAGSRAPRALLMTVLFGLFGSAPCARGRPPPVLGAAVQPAVARVMTQQADLLSGPCATGAIGDIALENGLARAVITRHEPAGGFTLTAGNLVDLAPLPGGRDLLNETFLFLQDEFPRQGRYTTVEIISSGGGSAAAVVRACGTDSKDPRIRIDTDYRLDPGAHWITIESRFTSTATSTIRRYRVGDAIQWGRTRQLPPGHVVRLPGQPVTGDWAMSVGDGASYALVPDGKGRFEVIGGAMWSDMVGWSTDLEPERPAVYRRHLVVGRGDTSSLAGAIAKLRGDPTGRAAGRVTTRAGRAIPGAVVELVDAKGVLAGTAAADPSGRYAIELAPGWYQSSASAPGSASPRAPLEIRESRTSTRDFALEPPSTLAWRIEAEDGTLGPVKISVSGIEGTPSPEFGPAFDGAGAERYILSPGGAGEVALRPGRYQVHASRGPERELIARTITATAGGRIELSGKLVRSVETPGFISADLHQHALPSFDAAVSLEDRVASNAAEGLEVVVSTDHNVLTDYGPAIVRLGLERQLGSIIGSEATTHSVGHFNALPLRYSHEIPRGGMFDPEGLTPHQIFERIRALGPLEYAPYIHVSHPRAGKLIGYFDLMALDPKTGLARDQRFATDFDGLEVISFGHAKESHQALEDWFALLSRGHRITAVGGSDTHAISSREVGWPRTYVCAKSDDPTKLDVRAFTEALRGGCATVSGGPFVVIEGHPAPEESRGSPSKAAPVPMGGLLRAGSGRFSVEVRVQAPSWVSTDRLTLFVDGKPRAPIPLESKGVRRFAGRIPFECKRDCFVVALVEGDRDLSPVLAKRPGLDPLPIALSNPIYVDVDGDDRFAPSGMERK